MSIKQPQYINKLRQTVQTGTLSPFIFNSFLEYQQQREIVMEQRSDKDLFPGQKKVRVMPDPQCANALVRRGA